MLYIHYVSPFHDMFEALRFVCLQWAAAGSVDERHDVEKERKNRNSVAAVRCSGAIPF